MKLRLPHKFQAALLAAIASVSFTTLSTGTLGAAFFVSGQAFAEDAEEEPSATIDIGDTNLDAQAAMEEEEGTAEKEPGSAPINEAGSNGGPGNNAGLLITESDDIDETALDTVVSSEPVAVTSGSADSTPSDDLGFTSNPYATGSDTSNGSDDFSLTGTAPAAAYVPGQSGVSAEEGDSAAGTGSGSSTNKTTTGDIGSIGGTGSGATGGRVARPMALTAPNMLSPVSSLSVDGSSLGGDSSSFPAPATLGAADAELTAYTTTNSVSTAVNNFDAKGFIITLDGPRLQTNPACTYELVYLNSLELTSLRAVPSGDSVTLVLADAAGKVLSVSSNTVATTGQSTWNFSDTAVETDSPLYFYWIATSQGIEVGNVLTNDNMATWSHAGCGAGGVINYSNTNNLTSCGFLDSLSHVQSTQFAPKLTIVTSGPVPQDEYTWKASGSTGVWDEEAFNWTLKDEDSKYVSDPKNIVNFNEGEFAKEVTVVGEIAAYVVNVGDNYKFTVGSGDSLSISKLSVASGATATVGGAGALTLASLSNSGTLNLNAESTLTTLNNTGTLNVASDVTVQSAVVLTSSDTPAIHVRSGGELTILSNSTVDTKPIGSGTGSGEVANSAFSNLFKGRVVDVQDGGRLVLQGNVIFNDSSVSGVGNMTSGVAAMEITGNLQINSYGSGCTWALGSHSLEVDGNFWLTNKQYLTLNSGTLGVDGQLLLGHSGNTGSYPASVTATGNSSINLGGIGLYGPGNAFSLTGGNLTFTAASAATNVLTNEGSNAHNNNNITLAGTTLHAGDNGWTLSAIEGASITFSGSNTVNADSNKSITLSGIGGSGSITKTGAGTLTLSGSNSYTGGTTVSAGTLVASNASALGIGAVNVTGGTLDLTTTVGTGSLSVGNGATLKLAGENSFTSTGALSLAPGSNLDVSNLAYLYQAGNTVTLGSYTDSATYDGVNITGLGSGQTGTLGVDANKHLTLTFGSQPEPKEGTFHVYVLTGQSNSLGSVKGNPAPADLFAQYASSGLLYNGNMHKGGLRYVSDPDWNVVDVQPKGEGDSSFAVTGPEYVFEYMMIEKGWFSDTPDTDAIGVIKASLDGGGDEYWVKGREGGNYDVVLDTVTKGYQEALALGYSSVSIDGLLYLQGESNDHGGELVQTRYTTFLSNLKADLEAAGIDTTKIKFGDNSILGEPATWGQTDTDAGNEKSASDTHTQLENLAAISEKIGFVYTRDLDKITSGDTMGVHYNGEAQITIGARYAYAFAVQNNKDVSYDLGNGVKGVVRGDNDEKALTEDGAWWQGSAPTEKDVVVWDVSSVSTPSSAIQLLSNHGNYIANGATFEVRGIYVADAYKQMVTINGGTMAIGSSGIQLEGGDLSVSSTINAVADQTWGTGDHQLTTSGTVDIADGATLTIAENSRWQFNVVQGTGNLVINDGVTLAMTETDLGNHAVGGSGYSDGNNGFLAGRFDLITLTGDGTIDVDVNSISKAGALADKNITLSQDGKMLQILNGESTVYHVRDGVVVYNTATGITDATSIDINDMGSTGATLELANALESGVSITSSGNGGAIKIDNGVSLAATSVNAASGPVSITGSGTFVGKTSGTVDSLAPADVFGTGVTLSPDWRGTVKIADTTIPGGSIGIKLNDLGNASSVVEFEGVKAFLNADSYTYAPNIKLTGEGLDIDAGTSNTTYTFNGDVSGNGKLKLSLSRGSSGETYVFAGDVKNWNGEILAPTNGKTITLKFTGDANTVNAKITKTGGTLHLQVANNATFGANVTGINNLTTLAGTRVAFNGENTSISGTSSSIGGTITNRGTMTLLADTVTVTGLLLQDYELYEKGSEEYSGTGEYAGNGYLTTDSKFYLVKNENGGTLSFTATAANVTLSTIDDGSVVFQSSGQGNIYYVNNDLVYGDTMDDAAVIDVTGTSVLTAPTAKITGKTYAGTGIIKASDDIGDGKLTFNGAAGGFNGTLSLTRAGTGHGKQLVLNNFSGTLEYAGRFEINNSNLGNAQKIRFIGDRNSNNTGIWWHGGGTTALTQEVELAGEYAVQFEITDGSTLNVDGAMHGNSFLKSGNGTVNLNKQVQVGTVQVTGGTLRIAPAAGIEQNTVGALKSNSGTTVELKNVAVKVADENTCLSGNVEIGEGASLTVQKSDSLNYNQTNTITLQDDGLLDLGDKRWTFNSNNTLVLNGGEIRGVGEPTYGALDFNGARTVAVHGDSTISANVRLRAGKTNFDVDSGAILTVSGNFGNDSNVGGTLEKTGLGTMVLSGNSAYDNGITITAGTLEANSAHALGAGAVAVNSGTLALTSSSPVTIASGSIASGATLTLANPSQFTVTSGVFSFASGSTLDLTALDISSSDTVTLATANGGSFSTDNLGSVTLNLGQAAPTGGRLEVQGNNLVLTFVQPSDELIWDHATDATWSTYSSNKNWHLSGAADGSSAFTTGADVRFIAGKTNEVSLGEAITAGKMTLDSDVTVNLQANQKSLTVDGLSLGAGSTLVVDPGGNKGIALNLGDVEVSGSASITSKSGGWNPYVTIESLDGEAGSVLNLKAAGQVDVAGVYEMNGGADSDFHGDIVIRQENGNANAQRVVAMNINSGAATQLADSVVTFSNVNNANARVGLGVNTDATVKGLVSDSSVSDGKHVIFSGAATVDTKKEFDNNITDGSTVHTLTINTAGGDYSTRAEVYANVNLVKTGEGSQSFTGNLNAMNGTVTASAGTLTLDNSSDNAGNLNSVTVNGGTLELNNMGVTNAITLSSGTLDLMSATDVGSLRMSGGTLVLDGVNWFTATTGNINLTGGTLDLTGVDLSSGASSYTLATATNGIVSSSGVSFTLDAQYDPALYTLEVEGNSLVLTYTPPEPGRDLIWDGSNSTWASGSSAHWYKEDPEQLEAFQNYDNATFDSASTDATATMSGNVRASAMTVADGADVTIVTGEGNTLTVLKGITVKGTLALDGTGVTGELSGDGVVVGNAIPAVADWTKSDVLGSGVTFGDVWTGTVEVSGGNTTYNSPYVVLNTINDLGTANSTVRLKGVGGYFTEVTIIPNIELVNAADGSPAVLITAGNGKTTTFNGDIKGDGDLLFDKAGGSQETFKFTGDLSGWIGTLKTGSQSTGGLTVELAGANQVVNAEILQGSNKRALNVKVDNAATFNKSVSVTNVELADNAIVAFNGGLDAGTVTLQSGSTATLKGESNIGTLTVNPGATLDLATDGTFGNDTAVYTVNGGTIANSGTGTVTLDIETMNVGSNGALLSGNVNLGTSADPLTILNLENTLVTKGKNTVYADSVTYTGSPGESVGTGSTYLDAVSGSTVNGYVESARVVIVENAAGSLNSNLAGKTVTSSGWTYTLQADEKGNVYFTPVQSELNTMRGDYYVNADVDGAVMAYGDTTNSTGLDRTNIVFLNGGNLNFTTMDLKQDVLLHVHKDATVGLGEGRTLYENTVYAKAGSTMTLDGEGTYVLTPATLGTQASLPAGTVLAEGADGFTGTVKVSKGSVLNGTDLSGLANGQYSTVAFNGVTGNLAIGEIAENIRLEDYNSIPALALTNGTDGETRNFSGTISGDGTLARSYVTGTGDKGGTQNYTFSGDVSNWNGTFDNQINGETTNLTFSGDVDAIGVTIMNGPQNSAGFLNVYTDGEKDKEFNQTVTASSFSAQGGDVDFRNVLNLDGDASASGNTVLTFHEMANIGGNLSGNVKVADGGNVTVAGAATLGDLNLIGTSTTRLNGAVSASGDVTVGNDASLYLNGGGITLGDGASLTVADGAKIGLIGWSDSTADHTSSGVKTTGFTGGQLFSVAEGGTATVNVNPITIVMKDGAEFKYTGEVDSRVVVHTDSTDEDYGTVDIFDAVYYYVARPHNKSMDDVIREAAGRSLDYILIDNGGTLSGVTDANKSTYGISGLQGGGTIAVGTGGTLTDGQALETFAGNILVGPNSKYATDGSVARTLTVNGGTLHATDNMILGEKATFTNSGSGESLVIPTVDVDADKTLEIVKRMSAGLEKTGDGTLRITDIYPLEEARQPMIAGDLIVNEGTVVLNSLHRTKVTDADKKAIVAGNITMAGGTDIVFEGIDPLGHTEGATKSITMHAGTEDNLTTMLFTRNGGDPETIQHLTLTTPIYVEGNTLIGGLNLNSFGLYNEGGLTDGSYIHASGTNNVIDNTFNLRKNAYFDVDRNSELTLTGDMLKFTGSASVTNPMVIKTGEGLLDLAGENSSLYAINTKEGEVDVSGHVTFTGTADNQFLMNQGAVFAVNNGGLFEYRDWNFENNDGTTAPGTITASGNAQNYILQNADLVVSDMKLTNHNSAAQEISARLDNVQLVNQGGNVIVNNAPAGTTQHIASLSAKSGVTTLHSATLDAASVNPGATLTFTANDGKEQAPQASKVELGSTILNGGTVNLAGTINVSNLVGFTPQKGGGYADADIHEGKADSAYNGFYQGGTYYLIYEEAAGSTVNGADALTLTYHGDEVAAFGKETGTNSYYFSVTEPSTLYYINGNDGADEETTYKNWGTPEYNRMYAGLAVPQSQDVLDTTGIVLNYNGAHLTLAQDLRDEVRTITEGSSGIVANFNGSVDIQEGVILHQSDLSGKEGVLVALVGKGMFDLDGTTLKEVSGGLTQGGADNWNGTVRASGAADDMIGSMMGNVDSTLLLDGVQGTLTNADTQYVMKIELKNGGEGAVTNKALDNTFSTGANRTFTNTVSGSGDILMTGAASGSTQSIAFTGDVSGWKGTEQDAATFETASHGTTNLAFSGAATEINVDINEGEGTTINLVAGPTVAAEGETQVFNGDIKASSLTVEAGANTTLNNTTAISGLVDVTAANAKLHVHGTTTAAEVQVGTGQVTIQNTDGEDMAAISYSPIAGNADITGGVTMKSANGQAIISGTAGKDPVTRIDSACVAVLEAEASLKIENLVLAADTIVYGEDPEGANVGSLVISGTVVQEMRDTNTSPHTTPESTITSALTMTGTTGTTLEYENNKVYNVDFVSMCQMAQISGSAGTLVFDFTAMPEYYDWEHKFSDYGFIGVNFDMADKAIDASHLTVKALTKDASGQVVERIGYYNNGGNGAVVGSIIYFQVPEPTTSTLSLLALAALAARRRRK